MQITFNLPYVFYPGADSVANALACEILLDALVKLNIAYLKRERRLGHAVPTLYSSGVVYARTTWWETIPALYKRGYGDCKSLTAALVAEYTLQGIECRPVFRFVPNLLGTDYHILVQTPDKPHGEPFEDPSKVLGMGKNENAHF